MNRKLIYLPLIGVAAFAIASCNSNSNKGYTSICTTYDYNEDGTECLYSTKTETYDANGNIEMLIVEYPTDEESSYNRKYEYTYDSNNNQLESKSYKSDENGTYKIIGETEYCYNKNGQRTLYNNYSYSTDGIRYLKSRFVYTYDLLNNLILKEYDSFNEDLTKVYKSSYKEEYSYNDKNQLIEEKGTGYNSDGSIYVGSTNTYLKNNFNYDSNSNLTSYNYYQYKADGSIYYPYTYKMEYEYDSNSNMIAETEFRYEDENTTYTKKKKEYTYDSSKNVLSMSIYNYTDGAINYDSSYKYTYEYDSNSNRTSEKEFEFEDDGSAYLSDETIYEYNKNNQLVLVTYNSYDEGKIELEYSFKKVIKYEDR